MLISVLVKIALSNPMEIYLTTWFFPPLTEERQRELLQQQEERTHFFRQSRNEFIKERLFVVTEEHEAKPL